MPRLTISQTNFTAGEISPRLYGRTDVDRYANAARQLLNAYPVIHGGAMRRPGTLFAQACKFAARTGRLIPFVYSRDAAYVLEFGHNYMRVFLNGVQQAEVATPFTESMLPDIDYVQGADTMFLAHPVVQIQRLRRFTDSIWDVSTAPFEVQPFDEQGHYLAADVTLSAATVGAGRVVTASAGVFLPTDVGRVLVSSAGQATITGYTSATVLTATITLPFAGVALASQSWHLDSSPQALLKPMAKDPVGSAIALHGSRWRAAGITLSAKTGAGVIVTADAAAFTGGEVGLFLYADSGMAVVTAFTDATHITVDCISDFASLTYPQGGYGLTADTFRAEDVGKYVRVNNGLCHIEALVDPGTVTATIITKLDNIVTSPPLAWTLEYSVWNSVSGYPRTVTLHEQRLVAAGSPGFPQTIWGSRTGIYLDFTKGVADSDSYSFTIASDEVNPIGYVAALRNMILHTYGGEFSLQGGVEKPITPTNVRIRPETTHGSKGVRPVTVGKESVFVQRAGRKVRSMGYTFEVDGYAAPDLTVLAEHITESGIVAMAYQQEPDRLLWAVRADGAMVTCTIDREQSVLGWARHYTDGAFESVTTIPVGDHEQTWVIVRRTVNGNVVRYLERFDDTFAPLLPGAPVPNAYPPLAQPITYGCTVDCGLSFDFPAGATVIGGLGHLEGKVVDVVADGAPFQFTVVAGSITLPRLAYRVLVGLHFDTQIDLLSPEVGTGMGTAQGNSMRTSEITVRFVNTLGCTVYDGDGDQVGDLSFKQLGTGVLDVMAAPFSGTKRIEKLGWDRGRDELSIRQTQPLPLHVLSVIRKYQVND